MDNELNMQVHIDKVVLICFYHLNPYLNFTSTWSTTMYWCHLPCRDFLVCVLILSQTNSVLAGLPAVTLASLQRVMHAAVRIVAKLSFCDPVTSLMKASHWLPIAYRIKCKLCLMSMKLLMVRVKSTSLRHSYRLHLYRTMRGCNRQCQVLLIEHNSADEHFL